jgi:hypothetical protein
MHEPPTPERIEIMKDFSHLAALFDRLSRERVRLSTAKTDNERDLRSIWVKQIEKEIEDEQRFLGLDSSTVDNVISDDDLLKELMS